MANAAAVKFVKQLIAAYSRFPTTQDTKELYSTKLQKWHLTQEQWDAALDILIAHEGDNLPPLVDIYTALKNAQYNRQSQRTNAMGWLYFTRTNGLDYAVRVISDGAAWLICPLSCKDAHGQIVEIHKNVGKAAALHIPDDAINVIISPDNPSRPDPQDMPTKAEVVAYMGFIEANLQRMSR